MEQQRRNLDRPFLCQTTSERATISLLFIPITSISSNNLHFDFFVILHSVVFALVHFITLSPLNTWAWPYILLTVPDLPFGYHLICLYLLSPSRSTRQIDYFTRPLIHDINLGSLAVLLSSNDRMPSQPLLHRRVSIALRCSSLTYQALPL